MRKGFIGSNGAECHLKNQAVDYLSALLCIGHQSASGMKLKGI